MYFLYFFLIALLVNNLQAMSGSSKLDICKATVGQADGNIVLNTADLVKFTQFDEYPDIRPFSGIEFEGIIPYSIPFALVAQMIKSEIITTHGLLDQNVVVDGSIDPEFEFDPDAKIELRYPFGNQNRIIKLEQEEYPTPLFFRPFELASQILAGKSEIQWFYKLLGQVEELGIQSWDEAGGIHIHVDALGLSFEELYLILKLVYCLDEALRTEFKSQRTRTGLAPIALTYLQQLARRSGIITDLNSILIKGPVQIVRWHPLYHTIEYRLFNSTLDVKLIELYRDFSQKLVLGIRQKNPLLIAYLSESKSYQLAAIAQIIGSKWR